MQTWIVTKRDVAEILNLSERRVTELIRLGVLPARRPTGFDLRASVRGYIAFLKAEPGSLKTERTRVTKLKADLLELTYKQRSGELIPKAVIDKIWWDGNRRIRDNVLNIPSRLAGLVAAEQSQDKCYVLMENEARQCLERIVDEHYKPQLPSPSTAQ